MRLEAAYRRYNEVTKQRQQTTTAALILWAMLDTVNKELL
jgi:hypothetical protein